MEDLDAQLMVIIVPAITSIVGILVTWSLAELRKLIKTKTDNAAAVQAFEVVADLVQSSVTSINQTARKTFEDGKLSTAEKVDYKRQAKALVLGQLPRTTRKILDKSVKDLSVYVGNRIEQTVVYENRGRAISAQGGERQA